MGLSSPINSVPPVPIPARPVMGSLSNAFGTMGQTVPSRPDTFKAYRSNSNDTYGIPTPYVCGKLCFGWIESKQDRGIPQPEVYHGVTHTNSTANTLVPDHLRHINENRSEVGLTDLIPCYHRSRPRTGPLLLCRHDIARWKDDCIWSPKLSSWV
jgi:hypothetical protein